LPFFLGDNFALVVKEYPSLLVNVLGNTYLRVTAFFPDPHTLSLYLGLALPSVFVWQHIKKTLLARVALALVVAAILLTFSRGAYAALLVTSVVALGILLAKNYRQYGSYCLIGMLVLSGVVFATPVGPRILSSTSSEDGSRTERLRLLQEAIEHSLERPLLGVGVGNYPLLVKPDAREREPIYVHNLYLDIVVETGFVGLLLFLSFVGSSLWRGFREWQRNQDPFILACCMGTVYFLLHGLFEAPLFSFHVMFALFLLLAYQAVPPSKRL
jgi:O-antigen ligase